MPDAAPDRPVAWRYVLPASPPDRETMSAQLWAAGARGVWEQPDDLVAWFADPTATVPDGGSWQPEPERDWQAAWKASIGPVRAGRFVVVPSWLVDTEPLEEGEIALVLDPGQAFGSGHHATTTLCLELLDALELTGRSVADIGCGSGVLAIAAARRGAEVVAVDIDPDAIEVSRRNAAMNGVVLDLAVGSVERIGRPAAVVVANLVTDVVVRLADDLVAVTGDTLVVSGIAAERCELVRSALGTAGLVVDEVRERDGWVALRGHPAGGPGSADDAGGAGRSG